MIIREIIIRKMMEKDLSEVSALEQKIFSKPWSIESFRSAYDREDTIYLVAEQEGRVSAYLGIWLGPEEGDLCNVAVAPECRRQGIAHRLMEAAFDLCHQKKINRILLEVRLSNEAAKQLYHKFSFVELGIRQGYYSEPKEDAVIMERIL